jgi:Skp family chaperone for outer membrane proteins
MRGISRQLILAGVLACAPAVSCLAQQTPPESGPQFQMPLRMLDEERLFRETQLGQRVLAGIRAAEAELEAENQRLFEQLAAEEQALADLRPTLSPDDFRARADAFDQRVESIRAERAQANQALLQQSEAEAQRFFSAATPVLVQLMAEQGVVAVLRPGAVILEADGFDLTDLAIARLDATLGDGSTEPDDSNP